jgi:hypothetical protein
MPRPSRHSHDARAAAIPRPPPLRPSFLAAEVTKRRVPGLHQITAISSVLITTTPRVSEEGAGAEGLSDDEGGGGGSVPSEAEGDDEARLEAVSEAGEGEEGGGEAAAGGSGPARRREGPAPPRYASLVEILLSKEVRGRGRGEPARLHRPAGPAACLTLSPARDGLPRTAVNRTPRKEANSS